MKKYLFPVLLLLCFTACKNRRDEAKPRTMPPRETADWIILTSPEPADIWGVYGNIDSTLLITTGFSIFRTRDGGKSWEKSNYKEGLGIFGFAMNQDTLLALAGRSSGSVNRSPYATTPQFMSVDGGKTWTRNTSFFWNHDRVAPLDLLTAPNGVRYQIDEVLTPICPNCTNNYVETPGFRASDGRRVALPQMHQLQSLYFDSRQRLYLSGSAATCGGIKNFHFCDGAYGVVYVSKKPLP
jgi:hypothetical protein